MRKKAISKAKKMVIKVGTTSVTHKNGQPNFKKMDELALVLTDLENSGYQIVLVSSGAIGCGMKKLGLKKRPKTLEGKQATASVGQGIIMSTYQKFFDEYHQVVGQILLTKDVFNNGTKRQNAINSFSALKRRMVIPIVNENDCVSTEEIEEENFGDNDILSAMTAEIFGADLLIILSDVQGLYDCDPNHNENAQFIEQIDKIDVDTYDYAECSSSNRGTGGMISKISAAQFATEKGIHTIIASGESFKILYDILNGKKVGTFFKGGKRNA
ncbi:MAG: glutamate 5-kinase [Eubacteriaceae bacterium]|jgi:glutamate 5-kinase|nr:glutamate 5-kinase [Eubacteriaceae bacterium]